MIRCNTLENFVIISYQCGSGAQWEYDVLYLDDDMKKWNNAKVFGGDI